MPAMEAMLPPALLCSGDCSGVLRGGGLVLTLFPLLQQASYANQLGVPLSRFPVAALRKFGVT